MLTQQADKLPSHFQILDDRSGIRSGSCAIVSHGSYYLLDSDKLEQQQQQHIEPIHHEIASHDDDFRGFSPGRCPFRIADLGFQPSPSSIDLYDRSLGPWYQVCIISESGH